MDEKEAAFAECSSSRTVSRSAVWLSSTVIIVKNGIVFGIPVFSSTVHIHRIHDFQLA